MVDTTAEFGRALAKLRIADITLTVFPVRTYYVLSDGELHHC